ncbi:drug resistance transporter Bcr/CflA subfamily [Bacteroides intestinalis CAG:315]|jgi:DHA1 family bicyclomycin/chloramphenicol resistance-like MFS transporter|uniref:MFS transporter n=1 Tax=Bacteroides intestinalis TaxID=329854 RepID=A0A412XWQ5_9BACE|nr:multidrug effflux MFS transporter [Bacteroides intestinalis]RGV49509.1 MFS transporter [Bacteroides intestinalis]RHA57671.1 MFS transporter [Bacteroides intestinalis]CDD93572.1 drug resistance transporter Bcr/CflA subfamily [Bacteroides intestinalis CAG:315]
MGKDNSKLFILILLGMLTAFGPFVTDMYLPSLPVMGEYFNTNSSMVQLGLTTSMIGLAVGQIFFGPLSDRYGRRIPLQVAMWLFIASTVCCLFAQSIQQFVAFRLIQGIAGAGGIVIARSIATDNFSGRDLAKMLAIIGAINGIAPVVAPIIGGVFTEAIGWQGIFGILLVLGVLLLAGCIRFRESLPKENRLATKWADTFHSFKVVLKNKQFVCYVLQLAFAQGVLFAYIASSPFIIQQHYGYSPFAFSVCFSINAIAIGGAAAFSVKFRRPANGTLIGCMGMLIFSLLECAALALGCSFWIYELLLLAVLFMMGMTFTTSTALAMECERDNAGTASALLGAVCFSFGGIVSPLVGIGNILVSTGVIFVICSLCSLSSILLALGRRRARLYFAFSTSQKR